MIQMTTIIPYVVVKTHQNIKYIRSDARVRHIVHSLRMGQCERIKQINSYLGMNSEMTVELPTLRSKMQWETSFLLWNPQFPVA